MIHIVRFLRGYVVFRASGGFHERFVNLCAVRQLGLWDVSVDSDGLRACVYASSYRRLIEVARTSGARLHVCERHGLGFFARRHKNRMGILVGVPIFFASLLIMSSMVWSIEVVGCNSLWEETVVETFEQLGVKTGCFSSGIDTDSVEDKALILLEKSIYWVSLNIEGSVARIEVGEKPPLEPQKGMGKPCNVVADFDGVIVSMNVLGGVAAIKPGNGVKKGDLLISGIVQNRDTTSSLYEAKGDVVARRTRALQGTAAAESSDNSYSLRGRRSIIHFFNLDVPLGKPSPQDSEVFTRTKSLCASGTMLPLSLTQVTALEAAPKATALSEHRQRLLALSEYNRSYRKELHAATVLSQTVTLSFDKGGCTVKGSCDCLEFMGVQKEIVTE